MSKEKKGSWMAEGVSVNSNLILEPPPVGRGGVGVGRDVYRVV